MSATVPPLLRVGDLRVVYGKAAALEGVSFEVAQGQLFGLIGPNGAGKTTLIETVTGFVREDRGEVVFAGERMNGLRPEQRARRGLARTFQSLELFEELTVLENLLVAGDRGGWRSHVVDLVRPGRVEATGKVAETMALLGISELSGALPTQLSNGQRKLVALGRALASGARMMMLDEPAAGLDTNESRELGRHLRELTDRGCTMLLVDHDMDLVLSISDRVLVLDFGRAIAEGTPEEIRTAPRVVEAYLGAHVTTATGAGDGAGGGPRGGGDG